MGAGLSEGSSLSEFQALWYLQVPFTRLRTDCQELLPGNMIMEQKKAVRQNTALPAEAEQVPHPLGLWGLG